MKNALSPMIVLAAMSFGISFSAQAAPQSGATNDGPPPAFDKIDVDGDRRISRQEAKLERQLFLHFDAFDTDTTNTLDSREYEKYKGY